MWVLADSTNGYFCKFEVYSGQQEGVELGLAVGVVKTLSQELKGRKHRVFFDNSFTSVQLLEDLAVDNTFGCGTARQNRKGFAPALKGC